MTSIQNKSKRVITGFFDLNKTQPISIEPNTIAEVEDGIVYHWIAMNKDDIVLFQESQEQITKRKTENEALLNEIDALKNQIVSLNLQISQINQEKIELQNEINQLQAQVLADDSKEDLIIEASSLNIQVDKRWSVDTLKQKIVYAKNEIATSQAN